MWFYLYDWININELSNGGWIELFVLMIKLFLVRYFGDKSLVDNYKSLIFVVVRVNLSL